MKLINKLLILSIATTVVAIFSISSAIALNIKSSNNVSFGIRQANNSYNVKFYTTFDGSDWSNETTLNVNSGSSVSIGDIPSISLSGYSFEGWVSSVPTSSNYSSTLSSSDISSLTITNDVTYYPILKSSSKVAYTHSNDNDYYYALNTDVTISYQTLKATYIGYRYVGITGIPSETASWLSDRDLLTSSGIYQFYESEGAALINRKIGFRVSDISGHWGNESTEYYGLYYFDDGDGWASNVLTRTDNTTTYQDYFYIPTNYPSLIFVRLKGTTTGWSEKKDYQSGDITLVNNKKYNSETETSSYSSSNITLDKNQDWDNTWTGCWSNY